MKKKISKILLSLCAICLFCDMANAQNDAFFYKNFEREARDTDVASMTSHSSQSGLNFGGFSTNETGLNFGDFSDDETGLNFGDFSDDETGLKFGDFEYEEQTVPLDSGLLLLSGLAFVFWVRDRSKKLKYYSILK